MTGAACVAAGPAVPLVALAVPPAGALVQLAVLAAIVVGLGLPLGRLIAAVFAARPTRLSGLLGPLERGVLRVAGVDPAEEMTWERYATAVIAFSIVSFLATYAVQRCQHLLPANPAGLPAVAADCAANTAVSFMTNTNWQAYGGETTMSHGTQLAALTVQNFVSAAVGLAVFAAFVRGFTRASAGTIGNFWVDLVRGTVHVFLPLAVVLALLLVSQGVVQTLAAAHEVPLVEPRGAAAGGRVAVQRIAVGPAASQVAIKQLGTNGGGFFNANSAHPLENPTPLSNLLELVAILLVPTALCFAFGELVGDRRQGWALLAAKGAILVPFALLVLAAEQEPAAAIAGLGIDTTARVTAPEQPGGNMEGKELRFGVAGSAIWAVATTAASNGSVNAMHDSFTPLGGLFPLLLMQLGEVIFGGVGSGLYGLVLFALVAVFLAGLMVGRTPEYLGKKIGGFEIRMAALAIILPCATVLVGTAAAVLSPAGRAGIGNPGPHGFTEVLYALSSAANNNGSAFAGLAANSRFYNALLAVAMLVGRFWVMLPVLAIAGALAAKKHVPAGPGTLPTHTPLFVGLLVAVVIVVGALSFLPALALGPVAEQLGVAAGAAAAAGGGP